MPPLRVRIVAAPGVPLPAYETAGAAGMDLRLNEAVELRPGERTLAATGLWIELPDGFEAQVRPRSGLAIRHGVTMVNSPGTVDADYRGELKLILINHGADVVKLGRGERVAQLVIGPVTRVEWEPVESLDPTERGTGGFGSTGK